MPPNRFESEVESFLEGSHGDRTHIKRADHPRLHHYAGRYYRENFFAHKARQHGDVETTNTTARPQQGTAETGITSAHPQQGSLETGITSAPEKRDKNAHFAPAKAMAVSIPHEHERAKAMTVSDKRPTWPTGPDCGTRGQYPLQTSSNQRDSHRLGRTPVTNVVNLSQKTAIFSEKSLGLTTFVTTGTRAPQKLNTQDPPMTPTGSGGAWPDNEPTHQATRQYTRPHWCGGRRRDRRARAGFEARRRTK